MPGDPVTAPYIEPLRNRGVYGLCAFPTGYRSAGSVGATATQLETTSTPLTQGVLIGADADNTDSLFVGFSDEVTADSGTSSSGWRLDASDTVTIPINDASSIWLIGGAASQAYVAVGVS